MYLKKSGCLTYATEQRKKHIEESKNDELSKEIWTVRLAQETVSFAIFNNAGKQDRCFTSPKK